jgi:hypothetical protein
VQVEEASPFFQVQRVEWQQVGVHSPRAL